MEKFNIGEKVVVSAKIKQGSKYRFGFIDTMNPFYGKIVTIVDREETLADPKEIPDDGYRYKIKEDNGFFGWASSMFSPLAKKICVNTKRIIFNFKN